MVTTRVEKDKDSSSFIVMIDNEVACARSTGKPHYFKSECIAQAFGFQLARGYYGDTVFIEAGRAFNKDKSNTTIPSAA